MYYVELPKCKVAEPTCNKEFSTNDSLGKNPIGFYPMNQTTNIGKNIKDSNPPKTYAIPLNQKSPGEVSLNWPLQSGQEKVGQEQRNSSD